MHKLINFGSMDFRGFRWENEECDYGYISGCTKSLRYEGTLCIMRDLLGSIEEEVVKGMDADVWEWEEKS